MNKSNETKTIILFLIFSVLLFAFLLLGGCSFIDNAEGDGVVEKGENCGDGFCSEEELINENCPRDCGDAVKILPSGIGEGRVENVCGDGLCTSDEISKGSCSKDCGEIVEILDDVENVCGDGFCTNDEMNGGSCPKDCGDTPL